MHDYTGKTALVTGAAKRLGSHVARSLAGVGLNVIIHYRTSDAGAKETAEKIRSLGVTAWTVQGFLDNEAATKDFVTKCTEEAGKVDVLVNSASIFPSGSIFDSAEQAFIDNLKINALAPLYLCRWFAGQSDSGSIVNIIDTRILDYDKKHVPYHLSKQALFSITRMLSVELAPKIRVNGVAPGLVLPPDGEDETYLKELAHTNPLNTWGAEQDISDAVLYLLGARFVTGQVLYVDGGRHMRGRQYGS